MKRIADTSILFLASSLLVGKVGGFTDTVVVVLVALTLTSALWLVDKNDVKLMTNTEKAVILGIFVLMIISWMIKPAFIMYAPILVYSTVLYSRPFFLIALIGIFEYSNQSEVFVSILILSALAAMLAYSTGKMEVLENNIRQLRDNSIENDIKLKEKNRQIIINQDNEIHLATLKERNRIAREIHDNVGHMLTRSILQVGALATIYKEEPLHSSIKEVNETLNVAMNNIRESVHDIHDESVDLKQAIMECTKEAKEKFDIRIDYDMSSFVPKDVKYSFIAIVKEAMSNIVKHSNGTEVYLMAREHPGFYQLIIEDNGCVDKKESMDNKESGIGLTNMKERVENLGGRIHISVDEGFKIFISVPKEK